MLSSAFTSSYTRVVMLQHCNVSPARKAAQFMHTKWLQAVKRNFSELEIEQNEHSIMTILNIIFYNFLIVLTKKYSKVN